MDETAVEPAAEVTVVEGTAEIVSADGHALVTTPHAAPGVTPQVKATDLVERLDVIREAMDSAMEEGVDYGTVPGTDKPALFKPGSEKLGVLFQLDIQLVNEKVWGPGDHLTVLSHATVFHAPSCSRLGYGEGVCTTRERKYAYRKQERTCPVCKATAVIKGKAEYGGGWLCWAKRGGCGTKFPDGDHVIEGQATGDVENPDLPDLWNTVVKMAEKRARVDAVLAVTGASALFTQDTEDQPPSGQEPPQPSSPPSGDGSGPTVPKRQPPTEKQAGFLVSLARDHGANGAEQETVRAYALEVMSGGREGTVSQTIENLKAKDDKSAESCNRLVAAALKWQAAQSDVPPDTDGLDVPEGEPDW